MSALMYACFITQVQVVKVLLKNGVNVSLRDKVS